MAQRTDALGDDVGRAPQLGVLRHEHRMQRVEVRAGHIPVEVVGREIERVGVRQHTAQAFGNGGTVFAVDADVDDRRIAAARFLGHQRSTLPGHLANGSAGALATGDLDFLSTLAMAKILSSRLGNWRKL